VDVSVCVDDGKSVKFTGLVVVEYAPRSKIPNPLGGYPSSHCKTVLIINSLMSAITHARETRRENAVTTWLVWTIRTRNDLIKGFRYRRHWWVGNQRVSNLCAQREVVNGYPFSLRMLLTPRTPIFVDIAPSVRFKVRR
jgi:hypothetical protein